MLTSHDARPRRETAGPMMPVSSRADPRVAAVKVLQAVLDEGLTLGPERFQQTDAHASDHERRLTRELVYGVLRHFWRLDSIATSQLRHPLRERDRDVARLLLVGLYQLLETRMAPHAAVSTAVESTRALGKPWAVALVNAVLRKVAGAQVPMAASTPEARYNHPQWLITALRTAWPDDWEQILEAGNARAPMTLRVNQRRATRAAVLERLRVAGVEAHAHAHVLLEAAMTLHQPRDVHAIPGFDDGLVSVQDAGAQFAAPLLDAQPGERVLDACAAPGGKAAHILERIGSECEILAIDVATDRAALISRNFARLGVTAKVESADATTPSAWWDGRSYDRILADVPCSGTGVIRRHPDIKHLRRAEDVTGMARRQQALLSALWPLLRPGGLLLYVTCSVLPEENQDVIGSFLSRHRDAELTALDLPCARDTGAGCQILPGTFDMDGFFYARLRKH